MRRRAFLFWLLLAFCLVAAVSHAETGNDLNQYLNQHYKKKILLLRHFYSADQLKYNTSGELLGQAQPGPWTLTGVVLIDGIDVSPRGIQIQGKRFDLASKSNYLDYGKSDRAVTIVIEGDPRTLTTENAEAVFSKIFLTDQDHFEDLVPQFWKPCIAVATAGGNAKELVACKFSEKFLALPGVHVIPGEASAPQFSATPQHGVVQERIGGSVSAPKPLYQPDPPYTTDAKKANVEGIVVLSLILGENGQAKEVWVTRPLGYGLDEMAIGALDTWKFAPAMKDGQPVAVKLSVEVEFRLH